MKPQLVVQLPSAVISADSVLHWSVFDADGHLQVSGESALDALRSVIASHFHDGEIRVLVPGELVLLTRVRIPTKQVRHIKQALPFMVEESLADNIEDVHLALPAGKLDWDGDVPVAVVRHHLLIDWLDQLYHHGIQPDFLGPDTLAAPWREHGRSYFLSPVTRADTTVIRVLCRDGVYGGQVLALQNLDALLAVQPPLPSDQLAALSRYVVSGGADAAEELSALAERLQAQLGCEVEVSSYAEVGAEVLAATAIRQREQALNLLQGGYRIQRRGGEQVWKRVASIAGIGLTLYALLAGGGGLYFSWRAQQVETQTFALYRELYPTERRVVSPRKQMANHLRGDGQPVAESLLPLLSKAATGFAVDANTRIDELRFNQQQKNLQVQLRTPSLEVLEQVKKRLDANGLFVEISSAVEQGASTVSRIQVREQRS